MWRVSVMQGGNVVRVWFNELCDAMEFASTCLECGDKSTGVAILEEED
jgi:hypothetical protein